jgi:hypothetical protein
MHPSIENTATIGWKDDPCTRNLITATCVPVEKCNRVICNELIFEEKKRLA